MNKLLTFDEFIVEGVNDKFPSLKKIYLATKRSAGQKWLSYKGFAGSKFFIQVTEKNIDKLDIDPTFPVLNYHGDITKQLLKDKKILSENVYNHPDQISKSGSKVEFHKLVGEDENIPKTVFTTEDALKLKFPIIAKPTSGHSGLGIEIFKDSKALEESDGEFDLFSEFVDKEEEHRFITFKGKPIFWMVRQPENDKAKGEGGETDEKMEFQYERHDATDIPSEYVKVLKKFSKIYSTLPYICFDIMKGKDGRIYVIESNAMPGLPFDSTAIIYENIYEDFYKESMDRASKDKLDQYSEELIRLTKEKDSTRFN